MKRLKMWILAGCLCSCFCLPGRGQKANVRFSGIAIPEDRGKTVEMWSDNALSLIGNSQNVLVTTQKDGHFSETLTLTAPAYYFFGYNTVYLAPGDTLNGVFDNYGDKTVYKGTNAAINNYLKGVVGSHSGSFIQNIGQNRLQDLLKVSRQIDSLATARRNTLKALQAPAAFKDMEEARIKADIVNTYLSIPFYSGMDKKEADSLLVANKARLAPLIHAICRDKYLNLDVVRSVISDCAGSSVLKETVQWSPRMKTLFTAARLAEYIGSQPDVRSLAEVDAFIKTCGEADIKEELKNVRKKVGSLIKGAPAPDLKLVTPEGKPAFLSQYKGKNLYIDLWATWCGPCLKESPVFHQLAETYRDSRNLVFLSVSVDTNSKSWQDFLTRRKSTLPEFNCTDQKGQSAWNVTGIPRFILIDKNFRIIEANAPAPSEKDKIEPILNSLK